MERKFGIVPKLEPGETRTFHLEIAVHEGKADVESVVKRISRTQGDRERIVEPKPEPNP